MTEQPEEPRIHQRSDHPVYVELKGSEEFIELRHRFRSFVIPWTIAFMGWYLLYVVLSNWAHGFMSTQVVGNVNVALIFGILQFVSTFLIAYLYGRHMNDKVDPLARRLEERYDAEVRHGGAA